MVSSEKPGECSVRSPTIKLGRIHDPTLMGREKKVEEGLRTRPVCLVDVKDLRRVRRPLPTV